MNDNFIEKLTIFRQHVLEKLLAERDLLGTWQGELSSSALSTAVAITSLHHFNNQEFKEEIAQGFNWLTKNINDDGGYGDTVSSPSNISTTLLSWAAFALVEQDDRRYSQTIQNIENYLSKEIGSLCPNKIFEKLKSIYGKDHTFSVPILTTLAVTGRLGKNGWQIVPQLPFELAVLPSSLFRFLKLEVVSYALPALIAIGLLRHEKLNSKWHPLSLFRKMIKGKVLRKLASIQPANGGFLEATPLTGFVLLSLSACSLKNSSTAIKCASFLKNSLRADGSFPIDTNLHTWVTTLSINALSEGRNISLSQNEKQNLSSFLLSQQFKMIHPYTNTAPGGWAWTPLPGAVPDADDTCGALISLSRLSSNKNEVIQAVENGIIWLLNLQNNDGGIPTFCRGWGKLPFDQSCPDITAHCIRAFYEWRPFVGVDLQKRIDRAQIKLLNYLQMTQDKNGSWKPLWFGNQYHSQKINPTYGTAQVVLALNILPEAEVILQKAQNWLVEIQNNDGSWGGDRSLPGTIEESALALNALSFCRFANKNEVLEKGLSWLIEKTNNGVYFPASPIGLYFASLWYSEKLYPLTFTLAAIENILQNGEIE